MFDQTQLRSGEWLRTSDAISELGVSRDTLLRRCRDGHFKPGQHYISTGPHPTSPRFWCISAIRAAMGSWVGPQSAALSLKQEAVQALGRFTANTHTTAREMTADFDTIRRALEALPDV
jgi:hypothetical protein